MYATPGGPLSFSTNWVSRAFRPTALGFPLYRDGRGFGCCVPQTCHTPKPHLFLLRTLACHA